jgi:predicted nucleic acid-binding protein
VTIVVDTGILAALALPLPYSDAARAKVGQWGDAEEEMIAPYLLHYELASVFRKAVFRGEMTTAEAVAAVDDLLGAGVRCVPPSQPLCHRAMEWSERLHRNAACDSFYVALAESEQAELWTTDRRLVRAAQQLGVEWVRWVGE